MGGEGDTIFVGNESVRAGTSVYDAETGQVMWITDIRNAAVGLETAGRDAEELQVKPERFKSRVATGRFSVGPCEGNTV